MKRCLACNEVSDSSIAQCTSCSALPATIDGFQAFAPDLAHAGDGFKPEYFAELADLEGGNFWFRARNLLIINFLKKYATELRSFLEIGCGTGYVLSGLSRAFPNAVLQGSEIFTTGLSFAASRLPSAKFMQMDARRIPFVSEFDVIGAFDVLEHIDEDECVLRQIHAALKPGGFVLVSVPQHAWLWSAVDEHACHVRRYSAKDLHNKIRTVGFKIVRSTSFVSLLLPAMLISRARKKSVHEEFDALSELKLPGMLNSFLYLLMRIELLVIRLGGNFALGGSRLVIARKDI